MSKENGQIFHEADEFNRQCCIINVATRPNDIRGQQRLKMSLDRHYGGERLLYQSETSVDARIHQDSPYGFKPHAFKLAFNQGYKYVLWVDASVWAVRNLFTVFFKVYEDGYLMQEAGHMAGSWSNDKCLEYFAITRDEAMKMPMYGNCGLLGLSADDEQSMTFLDHWIKAEQENIFRGSWNDHRHDMVCGSIIANMLEMQYNVRGNEMLVYAGPETEVGEDVFFKAKGMFANDPIILT